jgi:pheromone a factor receptor
MTNASTTKSRFTRLLFIAIALILAALPLSILTLYYPLRSSLHPYDWHDVHDVNWGIQKFPTYGRVAHYDGIIAIISGYLIFLAFGLGSDAVTMYKQWARKLGLTRIFPSLNNTNGSRSNGTSALTSAASRARLVTLAMMQSRDSKE